MSPIATACPSVYRTLFVTIRANILEVFESKGLSEFESVSVGRQRKQPYTENAPDPLTENIARMLTRERFFLRIELVAIGITAYASGKERATCRLQQGKGT